VDYTIKEGTFTVLSVNAAINQMMQYKREVTTQETTSGRINANNLLAIVKRCADPVCISLTHAQATFTTKKGQVVLPIEDITGTIEYPVRDYQCKAVLEFGDVHDALKLIQALGDKAQNTVIIETTEGLVKFSNTNYATLVSEYVDAETTGGAKARYGAELLVPFFAQKGKHTIRFSHNYPLEFTIGEHIKAIVAPRVVN
jgi:hypothetical protein